MHSKRNRDASGESANQSATGGEGGLVLGSAQCSSFKPMEILKTGSRDVSNKMHNKSFQLFGHFL